MNKVLVLSFFLLFFMSHTRIVSSQTPTNSPVRNAYCDLCGYCPPEPPPQSWSNCQKCIYPESSGDPTTKDTLRIDPTTNLPPTPAIGRQYTFLGCLAAGEGGFQRNGAGGIVNSLLKTIFSVVGGVAFLYLIYGSFVITTSQEDVEKLNYGRRLVVGAIGGLIFSLVSVMLVNLIANQVLKIPGFGN